MDRARPAETRAERREDPIGPHANAPKPVDIELLQNAGLGEAQIIYCPPLTVSVEPVMKPDSSDTRKTTQRATSSGSPRRRTGMSGRTDFSKTSFGTALTMSVAI